MTSFHFASPKGQQWRLALGRVSRHGHVNLVGLLQLRVVDDTGTYLGGPALEPVAREPDDPLTAQFLEAGLANLEMAAVRGKCVALAADQPRVLKDIQRVPEIVGLPSDVVRNRPADRVAFADSGQHR